MFFELRFTDTAIHQKQSWKENLEYTTFRKN